MADHTKHNAEHGNGGMEAVPAEHHVVPTKIYIAVFLALVALTWLTTYISTIDLGRLNIFVALSIAVFKASLVLLFFMHVKYGSRLTKMTVMAGIYWLTLLLFVTMIDLYTRGWMGVPGR